MPKSKRNKLVTLSKVKKHGKERKESLISNIRSWVDQYDSIYVFGYENMRNERFKEFRESLKEQGRFCLGSNKVMQVALGKDAETEVQDGLSELGSRIQGSVGLLFTSMPQQKVRAACNSFRSEEFARAGTEAVEEFVLSAGPLEGPGGPIPHTLEPTLRQHGLAVKLNKGVVELLAEHTVCTAEQKLDPHQAALLRIFGQRQAEFSISLLCCWHRAGGKVEELSDE